jgi:hypothetical protein
MRTTITCFALAALLCCGPPLLAEDGVPAIGPWLNLDTPSCPEAGKIAARLGTRIFGSKQDSVFADLRLDYGLAEGLALTARGVTGPRKAWAGPGFTIRHGGNDAELLVRYMPPNAAGCAAEFGVSLSDTPAQKDAFPTVQLLHQRDLGPSLALTLAPRAVFIEDNTLVGIGGGLAWKLTDTGQLVADVTAIVHGDNTYSTDTGARVRRAVWGVALQMRPSGGDRDTIVALGITNGLGGTTGMSLTTGLGGSLAGFFSFGCRY